MGTGVQQPPAERINPDRPFTAWRKAWRDLPDNPLPAYMQLCEQRRLSRLPLWRRRIVPGLIFLLALYPLAILVFDSIGEYYMGRLVASGVLADLAKLIIWVLIASFLASLLITLYNYSTSIMGFLAQPRTRTTNLMLDDMSALSSLTEHDIAAAIIRVYWLPLIRLALLGSGLVVLWLVTTRDFFYSLQLTEFYSQILLFAPLTITAMTVAGALAGLVYILWLLAMGSGLGSLHFATLAGSAVVIAYAAYLPFYVAIIMSSLQYKDWLDPYSLPVGVGEATAVAATLLMPYGLRLLLGLAETWPAGRRFIAFSGPILALLGAACIVATVWILDVRGYSSDEIEMVAIVGLAYLFGWSGTVLINPLAVPLPQCYGWPWGEWGMLALEWYRLPLLLVQQLLMVAVAAHYALRAIRLRRCNLA